MVSTALTFIVIVVMLRIGGAQVQAKMSMYDGIVTVTLGSVVAAVALASGRTLMDAVAAIGTLVVLQELTRHLQSRYLRIHHLVREPPGVFLWDGKLLEDRLKEKNISADEIRAAVRKAGCSSFEQVQIVVLENDGDWSVVKKSQRAEEDESAFDGLPIPGHPENSPKEGGGKAEAASPHRIP
jgi:uncharacterized membrane protein YcaP (DUF421 family)